MKELESSIPLSRILNCSSNFISLLDSTILDPASGSGTFLLNIVRRVLNSKQDGSDHSLEYKNIIENNIFGSELMLFPYLISEINILIQLSQVLRKTIQKGKRLNVFHVFPNHSWTRFHHICFCP